MTTPKSHRPWRDRLRDTVDRVDTWINGPHDHDTDWTDILPGGTSSQDFTVELFPGKVSPNVDHTPPPPIVTHPECATLTDQWVQLQAEADATRAWADAWHTRWEVLPGASFPRWRQAMYRVADKVRDYHAEAARITGGLQ